MLLEIPLDLSDFKIDSGCAIEKDLGADSFE